MDQVLGDAWEVLGGAWEVLGDACNHRPGRIRTGDEAMISKVVFALKVGADGLRDSSAHGHPHFEIV